MDISKAWGYGAIILPREMQWQGFVIRDPADSEMAPYVKDAIAVATKALSFTGTSPTLTIEGALCAAAFGALASGDQGRLSTFASALSQYMDKRFWVIDVYPDDKGTGTTFVPLNVETPEAARDEINRRAQPLKMGRALKDLLGTK